MLHISPVAPSTRGRKAPADSSPGAQTLPHTAAMVAEAIRSVVRPTAMASLNGFLGVAADLAGCDGVSVTALCPNDQPEALAATSGTLHRLAEQEMHLDQGPSLESARTTFTVVESDLAGSGRWRQWTAAATQDGIVSCLSMHLFTDSPLGAITFYSMHPREYTHHDVDTALTLAAHASLLVAGVRTEEHLWRATDARNLIGQAQGILMERYKLTAPAAFDLLNRTSQNSNRKLSAIASTLVTTGQL